MRVSVPPAQHLASIALEREKVLRQRESSKG
jgi:hypothetical protein